MQKTLRERRIEAAFDAIEAYGRRTSEVAADHPGWREEALTDPEAYIQVRDLLEIVIDAVVEVRDA